MPNPYVILVLVAAVLAAGWRYGEMRYTAGADAVTAAYAASNAAAAEKQQEGVREVIKWKEKRVVVYRDRVTEIKVAADQTGCLDQPLTAVGLGGLLLGHGSDPPGSRVDDAAGRVPAD